MTTASTVNRSSSGCRLLLGRQSIRFDAAPSKETSAREDTSRRQRTLRPVRAIRVRHGPPSMPTRRWSCRGLSGRATRAPQTRSRGSREPPPRTAFNSHQTGCAGHPRHRSRAGRLAGPCLSSCECAAPRRCRSARRASSERGGPGPSLSPGSQPPRPPATADPRSRRSGAWPSGHAGRSPGRSRRLRPADRPALTSAPGSTSIFKKCANSENRPRPWSRMTVLPEK